MARPTDSDRRRQRRIDVLLPTKNSGSGFVDSLEHLQTAIDDSLFAINRVVNADASTDGTQDRLREWARDRGHALTVVEDGLSLPKARERLIDETETEWAFFLDDDVFVHPDYFADAAPLCDTPIVGAIQGRKHSRTEHPSIWVRRRSRRGGTHATLIRRAAVSGIDIPTDVTVLEDEFIRRAVESNGYLWMFDHQAVFEHRCRERHPIGFQEGRVAGKYGLKPLHEYLLTIPHAIATRRNPLPHCRRVCGWLVGNFDRT